MEYEDFNGEPIPPTIIFSQNGNTTYASSHNTTITVNPGSADINYETLMYRIVKGSQTPLSATDKEFFSGIKGGIQLLNGQTVTIQGTAGNDYFLWVYAEDVAGNCI